MPVIKRVAALLLVSTAPVFAQAPVGGPEPAPAGTAEGAKAVIDGLAPFIGRSAFENGTLKVEPDPAGYRLTFDPKPFAEALGTNGGALAMSPFSTVISRREDGTWNYFSDSSFDFTMRTSANGMQQVVDYDFGQHRTKGVFAPELAAVLSGTGTIDGASVTATQPEGDISVGLGAIRFDLTGRPAADGAVDMELRQSAKDFRETVAMKQGPDTPPDGFKLDVKAASYDGTLDIAAMRSQPLAELYGFFVANPEYLKPAPDKAKLAGTQADLKAKLGAVLPLWNGLKGAYALSDIAVAAPLTSVKAQRMNITFDMTGIAEAATVGYALGVAGLDVSSALMPPWAASLLPREMDLRFKVDGVDLRTPVDVALADFDLARADPISAEAQARIESSFLSKPPRFVIGPSRIVAPDYDLAMSGSVVFQGDRPALTMDISAGGIDKAIATLQNAAQTVPDVNQAVGALAMAKGFGKTLADGRTQWIVDASSDGSVKVNGFQVKAPDPVPPPNNDGVADDTLPPDQAPTDDNALPEAPPQ